MLINLYKSLVTPIVERGSTTWGPYYILDQQSIKKMQRRATRLLTGLYDIHILNDHVIVPSYDHVIVPSYISLYCHGVYRLFTLWLSLTL